MKAVLRNEMKLLRNGLSSNKVMKKSKAIMNSFLMSKYYLEAETIFTYVSMGNEVSTRHLIRYILMDNKRVAVPRVTGKGELTFYYIHSFEDLEPSKFNLLEPKMDCEIATSKPDVIVIPGLAFDRNKNRLGYGGGFYDSYLARNKESRKIALAYDFQIVKQVPCEEFDIDMDRIITDRGVL